MPLPVVMCSELREPLLQKPAFRLLLSQLECALVRGASFSGLPEPAIKSGACGMRKVIVAEVARRKQRIDQGNSRRRTVTHRHGPGPIERDRRRGTDRRQQIVES